ncbi:MAG: cytochrome C oxidase subunit IV family protein [Gemmatimonadales bacterium]
MSEHEQHSQSRTGTYVAVFGVLTVITAVEIGIFYVPQMAAVLPPLLLLLSAAKFTLVVGFYMHLKGDHSLFKLVFMGPLLIVAGVLVALLFLFGRWGF